MGSWGLLIGRCGYTGYGGLYIPWKERCGYTGVGSEECGDSGRKTIVSECGLGMSLIWDVWGLDGDIRV